LAEGIVYRLVVLPFVRIGRIIHANLEVLRAGEEEIAIVRELATIGSGVVMNDLVSNGRGRYHFL
jgi:hypothetical protein